MPDWRHYLRDSETSMLIWILSGELPLDNLLILFYNEDYDHIIYIFIKNNCIHQEWDCLDWLPVPQGARFIWGQVGVIFFGGILTWFTFPTIHYEQKLDNFKCRGPSMQFYTLIKDFHGETQCAGRHKIYIVKATADNMSDVSAGSWHNGYSTDGVRVEFPGNKQFILIAHSFVSANER